MISVPRGCFVEQTRQQHHITRHALHRHNQKIAKRLDTRIRFLNLKDVRRKSKKITERQTFSHVLSKLFATVKRIESQKSIAMATNVFLNVLLEQMKTIPSSLSLLT